MDRDFLHYLGQDAEKANQNIAVPPFYQNPLGGGDRVFSTGIPVFISDTFSAAKNGVVHPYISFHAADGLGITGKALADVTSAQQLAEKLEVPFVIFGSYQFKARNTLHIILNVYNHKTKKALSPAVDFETPLDDSFFSKLEKAVVDAFQADRSAPKIKPVDQHPLSLRIFKEYVQGHTNAGRYQMNQLKLAEAWLKKARSESLNQYPAANLSLARVYFMQGLLNKLQKKEFGPQWLRAHEIISELPRPLSEEVQRQRLLKRFVDFEGVSIQATGAFLKNDLKATNSFSELALTLVPEDGIMQNLYLRTARGKANKNIVTDNAVCF